MKDKYRKLNSRT